MNTQMEMNNIMDEEELMNVSGGKKMRSRRGRSSNVQKVTVQCQHCPEQFLADMNATKVMCPSCRGINSYYG